MRLPDPNDHFVWARPGESLKAIAMYFADLSPLGSSAAGKARARLIEKITAIARGGFDPADPNYDLSDLDPRAKKAVDDMVKAIFKDHINLTGTGSVPLPGVMEANLDSDNRFIDWMRIHIPDATVDVVEAYVKSVLEPLGNTVHFVDTFEAYHSLAGEIHCGTNALRTPLEETFGFTTRWWDPGVYDPAVDTTYRPEDGPTSIPGSTPQRAPGGILI